MGTRAAALLAAFACSASTAAWIEPEPAVRWVWAGAVTTDSAVVKARVTPPDGPTRLILSMAPDLAGGEAFPSRGAASPDPDGVVSFELRGLAPDRLYHYAVEVAGRRGPAGRLRTFASGPMSFRVVFGSCATTGSSHRIFSTMAAFEALFVLHMGDFHYENIAVNNPATFRRAYDQVLASPRQAALYRSTPIAYVWDDHDFGPNDTDRRAPGRDSALRTYRQCVPHYPLVKRDGEVETIQQAFTVGRVRFILTDGRAARSPIEEPDGPQKSMLGLPQRRWLEKELADAAREQALVVWANPVPWITKGTPGTDQGWEPFGFERTHIADRIEALGLVDRLLMVSGDAHMVAIDDGSNSNYASDRRPGEPAFPVVQAAPFDRFPRAKGGPYSHGVVAHRRLFGLLKEKQFGLLSVQDDGQALTVEATGRDSDGELLSGMRLVLRCDPGCRVVR